MKMPKRLISALASMLVSVLLFALPVSAERQYENCRANCKVYDEDGVFDESERLALDEKIQSVSDEIDMYVAVCIRGSNAPSYSDNQVMTMADDLYDELFNPQYGVDTDGVLLYLNLSTRYAYISTSGTGQFYYSNAKGNNRIDDMIDSLKPDLRAEDYSGAVYQFCSEILKYYHKGIEKGSYHKDENTGEYYWMENGEIVHGRKLPMFYGKNWTRIGLIAGGVGLLTALITCLIIRSRYKLVKSLSATNYISDQDTSFYVRDDIFIRTHTSKSRIDSGGSGGGGGGFSHMSSGGHSHGGGGGHW